ncbi:MAG: Glucan 1,4-alpha-glucosidase, partial [Jatrophihabitans sp.]|nr:Glucan 1,4-alpha-glucosidase [Jatrophihabitans sp.]
DPTSCPRNGQPWPTTNSGSGHLWPVLSGERAETALAQGNSTLASSQLSFLLRSASGEGLVPEQAWENPAVAADPFGTDPTIASIGFADGQAAGSASPLTWAQAQEVRLITDVGAGRITDRPDITTKRYVTHAPPGSVPVTITTPTGGQTVSGTTTVTGTTTPGAHVVVSSVATDVTGANAIASTTADSAGAYSVSVPVAFGSNIITVSATTATGTGVARVDVLGELVGGTTVLDTNDPANDDNGPGTYQYPTSPNFQAGSFDITRFQVLTKDGTVYLRTTLRNLAETFGEALGAQLIDLYVHRPGATPTSQAAAHPTLNYTIAAQDAWSQRLEVQGFQGPVWVNPNGDQIGAVNAVVASIPAKTVTIAVPEAQFGTPATGWSFVETVTGQDGFSPDQARGFAPTPQDFAFGVCAVGASAPICGVNPATVPKVLDTLTPPGVAQSVELDPTQGPVVLRGVAVG